MASYTIVGMLSSYIKGFPILEPTDEMYKKLSYNVQCFHFTPECLVHLPPTSFLMNPNLRLS